jgi:hypothetical protein
MIACKIHKNYKKDVAMIMPQFYAWGERWNRLKMVLFMH